MPWQKLFRQKILVRSYTATPLTGREFIVIHKQYSIEQPCYIYLEMPNFKKSADELASRLDEWLFFIKNLEDFQAIPQIFSDEIVFVKAFEKQN